MSQSELTKQNILQESSNQKSENKKIRKLQLKPIKDFEIHRRERQKGQKNTCRKLQKFLYQS